jgi:hypothetical protein
MRSRKNESVYPYIEHFNRLLAFSLQNNAGTQHSKAAPVGVNRNSPDPPTFII